MQWPDTKAQAGFVILGLICFVVYRVSDLSTAIIIAAMLYSAFRVGRRWDSMD